MPLKAGAGPVLPLVVSAMWGAHLLSISFQTLAVPGARGVPIPEIVGLAFAAVAVLAAVARGGLPRFTAIDAGVAAWLCAVGIGVAGGLMSSDRAADAAHEGLAAAAMGMLYVAIRLSATRELLQAFPRLYIRGAMVAAALGLAGWIAALFGVDTPLAFPASTPYLYFGRAARAQAFLPTPSLLASLLMLAIFLLVAEWRRLGPRERAIAAGVLGAGFLLTLTKTLICLAAGLAVAWWLARRPRHGRRSAVASVAIWACAAAVYVGVVHWAAVTPAALEDLRKGYMVAGAPVATVRVGGEAYHLMRTNYFYSKLASLWAIERSWPLGIGPGRHGEFIRDLQAGGRYPESLWEADPHSTYLGAAAELGLAGLIGLACAWGAVAYGLRRLAAGQMLPGAWVIFVGALAAVAIEAISTDVMNFRHYWWLIGVIAAWHALPPEAER